MCSKCSINDHFSSVMKLYSTSNSAKIDTSVCLSQGLRGLSQAFGVSCWGLGTVSYQQDKLRDIRSGFWEDVSGC